MKKILSISAALLCLLSCKFLEVENVGKSDIDGYFSEVTALEPALYGIYHGVYGLYDHYLLLYPEVASDEVVLSSTSSEWLPFLNHNITSSDESGALGLIWKNCYGVIGNCNQVIHFAPKLRESYPDSAELIDNCLAQALFIRALMHFNLVLTYAQNYSFTPDASHPGVAILDHIPSLSEEIARSSVNAVYESILQDIETALKTFPASAEGNGVYMAGPLACKALLARVYLYMRNYGKAASCAGEVIDAVPLVDRDGYCALFCTRAPAKEEGIFRLNGKLLGTTSYKFYYHVEPVARPSERVKALFDNPDDIRASLLGCGDEYPDVVMKYNCIDEVSSAEERYYHPVVLRVSEMYLIRAEAECETGELEKAAADIRALESRALGVPASAIELDCSSREKTEALIEMERIKELCFEGHRFWDLGRRHKAMERTPDVSAELMSLPYPDYRWVLPIPQVELEANPSMINNPVSNE